MEEKTKKNPNMHTDIRKQKKKQINRKKGKKLKKNPCTHSYPKIGHKVNIKKSRKNLKEEVEEDKILRIKLY